MNRFKEGDRVCISFIANRTIVKPGTVGIIWTTYGEDSEVYEVDFPDENGKYFVTLLEEELEAAPDDESNRFGEQPQQ